jgi:rare lipoprotein A
MIPAELRVPNSAVSGPPIASPPAAKIVGNIPQRGSNKVYRLQVGSFLIAANAVRTLNKLKELGLNPAYEKYGDYTRVIFTGIRANDVSAWAEKLGPAGFPEIWCREEK